MTKIKRDANITIRIPKHTKTKLIQQAEELGMSVSDLIISMLDFFFKD